MERVRQRAPIAGEHLERRDEERRLAAPRLPGPALGTDDITEMDALGRAGRVPAQEELEPARAVDEVEEHELAHIASGHDPARDTAAVTRFGARLGGLGLGLDDGDVDPVGIALGGGHGARV